MSNILRRSLIYACSRNSVRVTSHRCFSVSKCYLSSEKEEEKPQFSKQRIEDIIAEFEKPLVESDPIIDPRTTLLESVEKFKPKRDIVSKKNMEKLHSQLNNAYTVDQLATIVVAHKLMRKGLKKRQLVNSIIEKHWGIKTTEQIKEEETKRQLDIVKQSFPASRQELFFIIGDNGNTIRNIEQQNDVKVTIDVHSNTYIVEGPSIAVAKAKKEILTHLDIKQDVMNLPTHIIENHDLKSQVSNALADISKVAGVFISLKENQFTLASISEDGMENAKRLLKLMLHELNVSNQSNPTFVHTNTEFTVLPLHDPTSMSFYDRKLNWSRLEGNKQQDGKFKLLGSTQEYETIKDMSDLLLEPFNNQGLKDISMEARFGNLLFQNANITNKISTTDVLNMYKNRTLFFNSMPPRQLSVPFIPLTLDGGFHQRSVQLSYINNSILENSQDKEMALKKLVAEFIINENGDITLKNITGIKNQSVIDILGIYGNVDIRLLANHSIDYSNNQDILGFLTDKCELTSYSELNAPKAYKVNDESNMILSDITFLNKKRYLFDTGLVSINRIEQQDKRVSRTEMIVNSVDPETLNLSDSVDRWPSFSNVLSKISSRWNYSTL